MNMDITTQPAVGSLASPLRRHRQHRLEIHNIEVDETLAEETLCGNLHLPSGRVCLLPERHRGGCQFTARGRGDSATPTAKRPVPHRTVVCLAAAIVASGVLAPGIAVLTC